MERTGHLCACSICPVNSNQVISRGLRECKQTGESLEPTNWEQGLNP